MQAKTCFLILLFILLCKSTPILAGPVPMEKEDTGFAGNIVIRQERYKIGSVSVIKPVSVDLRILNTINVEGIKSIEDYALWLKKNVKYRRDDSADVWSLPDETLTRKYGDCEDFAFLNAAFLHVMGYKPKVIAIVGGIRKSGHAICAFRKGDHYLWFDNAELKKISAASMEEFTKHIFRRYACFSLFEIGLDNRSKDSLSDQSR